MAAKTWIGWGLAIAGVVAAGPLVLGRGSPALTSSHDEIARMSEVERTALKRKYDQYRALTEQQRGNLRTLHQQVEADRASGARYLTTMNDYCDWLKTIDSWQQDELAHIDDPLNKAKRVDEIAKERQQTKLASEASHDDESPPGRGTLQASLLLTEPQLNKVFDVLAKRSTGTTEEEQKAIDSHVGLKRMGLQAKALKRQIPSLEQFFRSISDAELKEMIEASGNADLLALLTKSGDMPHQTRVNMAKRGILFSVYAQFRRESASATDAELQTFFKTLSKEIQDQLLQQRAEDFKSELRLRRLAGDPDIAELRNLGQVFSVGAYIERLGRRGGFPGGPNGEGRPGGPDGDRPPMEGRRGGEGERPFRPGNGRRGQFGDGPPPRPGEGDGPPPRPGEDNGPPSERPEGEDRPPRDDRPPPRDDQESTP